MVAISDVGRRHVARRAVTVRRLDERVSAATRAVQPQQLLASALATSLALTGMVSTPSIAAEAPMQAVQGFEEFAAKGGKMKADPKCFFSECVPGRITIGPGRVIASPR
jgi:acyl-CoA hydrolase